MVVGMGAAIMQGVPATTLDTDLWLDLSERQYMLPINLALKQGATMVRQTVVALKDGSLVNFYYRLDGVASFVTEWRRSVVVPWRGLELRALSLERIIRSKEAADRLKDHAVLPLLRDIVASKKKLGLRR